MLMWVYNSIVEWDKFHVNPIRETRLAETYEKMSRELIDVTNMFASWGGQRKSNTHNSGHLWMS